METPPITWCGKDVKAFDGVTSIDVNIQIKCCRKFTLIGHPTKTPSTSRPVVMAAGPITTERQRENLMPFFFKCTQTVTAPD